MLWSVFLGQENVEVLCKLLHSSVCREIKDEVLPIIIHIIRGGK